MGLDRPTFEVQWVDSVTSTQDVLKDLFQQEAPEGIIIAARQQTKGRGRRDRSWDSPLNLGLWCSVLVIPGGAETSWTWTPLWAGVVLWQALKNLWSGLARVNLQQIQLKWPNDLMFGDQKLGGILAERVEATSGRRGVILGMGLNLQQQREDFPEYLRDIAISILQVTGKRFSAEETLTYVKASLEHLYPLLNPLRPGLIGELWMNHVWGREEGLKVYQADQVLVGACVGLGNQGELRLRLAENDERLILQADKIERVRTR